VFERALMQNRMDPMPFVLAEELGMTVERLMTGRDGPLSNREYVAWCAFYVWRDAMRKLAAKEAK
jgi:hypothetical protein